MKLLILVSAALIACGSGIDSVSDAGMDEPLPIHNPPSGLCCYPKNPPDSFWDGVAFECSADSGPDYSNIPWLCNYNTTPTDCEDPACVVGSSCEATSGYGVVGPCELSPDF
jgi:hypothetical protein